MKWPCKECIVRARCSQECPKYKNFRDYMMNVVSPLILLGSTIIAAMIMLYLSVLHDYHIWTWIFMGGSWAAWILIQYEDSPFMTFFSPAILPGFIVIKILAHKYKRA